MAETQLQDLLEAGVHFGHQSSRWNPKMKRFIFAERNGIHIIDLKKTHQALLEAQRAAREVTLESERVLFVCTKRQLRPIIEAEAARCGGFWVTERWLGGMLTNFATMKKQIRRLKELERGLDEGGDGGDAAHGRGLPAFPVLRTSCCAFGQGAVVSSWPSTITA